MSKRLRTEDMQSLLVGKTIRAVDWYSGGTDRDEDDYVMLYVDGLKIECHSVGVYTDDSGDVPAEA